MISSMIASVQATDRARLLSLTRILVFVFIVLATLLPFDAPALVGGACLLQAFWIARDHGDLGQRLRRAAWAWGRGWIPLLLFFAYLLVRLLPPPINTDALPGLLSFGLFLAFVFVAFALYGDQNDDVQQAIAEAVLAAFVTGAGIHAFEETTNFALRRLVWTWIPGIRPRPGKLDLDGDTVRNVVFYIANPTSTVLAALLWPALLLARLMPRTRGQQAAMAVGVVLCAYAIVRSDQATSKMALVAGAATWTLVALLPRVTRPLLAAIWIGSNVLVLPLALYAYSHEWYRLPPNFSSQHRVVLWGVTAEKTLAHPLFGIGTGRTPEFDQSTAPDVAYAPRTRIPVATNRHAHNVFLQLWYEDGALGVLLFMLAGLPVIGWIAAQSVRAQPLLAAAFVSAVVGASFSYSLLAAWFLATFAISALFGRFAVRWAGDDRAEDFGSPVR